MKYTENFKLKKPEQTDSYNVDDFNDNTDLLDKLLMPEDISNQFIVTPVGETSMFATVRGVRVYKQGKVVSGSIEFDITGGGEHELYFFDIPAEYSARTMASTITIGNIENDYNPYCNSAYSILEGPGLVIAVNDPNIVRVFCAFTYICD